MRIKRCAMLIVAFCVVATQAVGSIPITYFALFDYGSAELTETGRASVKDVVTEAKEALSQTDAIVIYVSGYADRAGPEDFNMGLSKRRAEAIANALMAAGMERKYLEVSWHGEHELPIATPDGVREQANRSVLLSVWGK